MFCTPEEDVHTEECIKQIDPCDGHSKFNDEEYKRFDKRLREQINAGKK